MLSYMSNRYNFSYFEAEYRLYLHALNTKPVSIKNYTSDLRYFFSWLKSTYHIDTISYNDLPVILGRSSIAQFYSHIENVAGSESTTKRRISTIRSFIAFCVKQRWLTENTAKLVTKDREISLLQSVMNDYFHNCENTGKMHDLDRTKAIITNFLLG